jgi:hypothetical protein
VTLVEFLHPLKSGKQRDVVLAAMYYFKRYKDKPQMTAAEVKSALVAAKIPKAKTWNVNDVLGKSAPFVHAPGADGGVFLFELTDTGERAVRDQLGLPTAEPEVEHDVGALQHLAASLSDEQVKSYISEALTCLQIGALRATVVFVWTGAVATLRDTVWAHGAPAIDAAVKAHRPNAPDFKKKDDFAYVNDANLLQVAQDLAVVDKTQKQRLQEALDLRNSCGHPSKYSVGEKKVSAFIEDVVGIIWK